MIQCAHNQTTGSMTHTWRDATYRMQSDLAPKRQTYLEAHRRKINQIQSIQINLLRAYVRQSSSSFDLDSTETDDKRKFQLYVFGYVIGHGCDSPNGVTRAIGARYQPSAKNIYYYYSIFVISN